ncbi:COG1361 S-layer family protein [Candidatus Woesearchaeota archaeon]|nr:COG1361 S-layer family protein [Candidatus Woesearchaeota archaeon]
MDIKKRCHGRDNFVIIGILILAFSLCSLSAFGAASSTSGRTQLYFYNVNVSMINYEPTPAEAGRYVTVRFKIENSGAETAQDVVIEIIPKYPFSLDPGESAVKSVGSVRSRQLGDTGVIKEYRLKVDENAIEGGNEIELRYSINNEAWIKLDPFYINILPHDILLSIESIEGPDMIKPGDTSKIDINLDNLAMSFIKDMEVKLNLDSLPFATLGSTNSKIIRYMGAGSKESVSFDLIAEPDAESDLYKIPIEIKFFDRLGNEYSKNETVGLIVGAEPELIASIDSSEIYGGGETGEVVIKFVNKGVSDIKFLDVTLKESDGFRIISPKGVYVGNIDSDDYETADFKISLKKTEKSEEVLSFLVDYMDSNNNKYSYDIDLPLKLYSSSEAKSMGLKKGSSKIGILIVLIIVIGGFFIYKRWRKKRKGEKAGSFNIKIPLLKKS